MAYEIDEIKMSQQIFYYLLENFEIDKEVEPELFEAYSKSEAIQNLVKSQGEIALSEIEKYDSVIYLIPNEDNVFLGFSKARLKEMLCKSGATDKDYYLAQFVILTLLVEFFDGQGPSSKSRDYMKVGELQNCVSERLRQGIENVEEEEEELYGIAYRNMHEAYEALRSDDKGSRAKTTKEGFMHTILTFLDKQKLIEYVPEDEMIKTSKKLDNLMDWNLLNQNNYQRIRKVLNNE